MISRREFIQVAAATAALSTGVGSGLSRAVAQQRLTEKELLAFEPLGNVTLVHVTDIHGHLMPLYFREPSTNLGVGEAKGLPPHVTGKVGGDDGREVVLGIRPEDVDERSTPREGEALHGRIASVLPVGSDQFLGIEMEGKRLFCRVGKELHHNEGDNVVLAVNTHRLHLFDKASGQSLLW